MAYTKLIPRHTTGANVEEISRGNKYRLYIPAGPASQYRFAQLDDYTKNKRSKFPLHFPLALSVSARVSSKSIPGTWGFGLWNDPFGLSLGFGGNPFRLPALPNAVWFFGASEDSYLSFRPERSEAQTKGEPQIRFQFQEASSIENRASTTSEVTNASSSANHSPDALREHKAPANGFLAQTFRSPRFHPSLILAGLGLPFSRKFTRRILGKVIGEDGIRLSVDVTQWHRYKLEWLKSRVLFEVDDNQVFESPVSPHPPLGLVIWIDNQYAAFTPEGKIGFGVLANLDPATLEIRDLEVD